MLQWLFVHIVIFWDGAVFTVASMVTVSLEITIKMAISAHVATTFFSLRLLRGHGILMVSNRFLSQSCKWISLKVLCEICEKYSGIKLARRYFWSQSQSAAFSVKGEAEQLSLFAAIGSPDGRGQRASLEDRSHDMLLCTELHMT